MIWWYPYFWKHPYCYLFIFCLFLPQQRNICRSDLELWMMYFSCISINISYEFSLNREIRRIQNHVFHQCEQYAYIYISIWLYIYIYIFVFFNIHIQYMCIYNYIYNHMFFLKQPDQCSNSPVSWGALQSWEAKCLWCIYGTSAWWRSSCTSFTRYSCGV